VPTTRPPRLYVCGPMTGLPQLNFPSFFEADKQLRDAGYDVLNPADRAGRTEGKPWDWYLRRCIKDVVDSDALALLPGWRGSRGARLEHHIAQSLFMDCRSVEDWLEGGD
jgi:hypothetical protein